MFKKFSYLLFIIFLALINFFWFPFSSLAASVTVDEYECIYTPSDSDSYKGVPEGFTSIKEISRGGISDEKFNFPVIASTGTSITLTFTYDDKKKNYKVTASSSVNISDNDIYIVDESVKTSSQNITSSIYYGTTDGRISSDNIKCPNIRIFGYCSSSDASAVFDSKTNSYTSSSRGCYESHGLISMYPYDSTLYSDPAKNVEENKKNYPTNFINNVLTNEKNKLYFSKVVNNHLYFEFGTNFTPPSGDSIEGTLIRLNLVSTDYKITKKYGDSPSNKISKDLCCYYTDAYNLATGVTNPYYFECSDLYDDEFDGNYYNYCKTTPEITVTYKVSLDGKIENTSINNKKYKLYNYVQYAKVFANENEAPSQGLLSNYSANGYKNEGYYLDEKLSKKYNASNLKANDNITIYVKMTKKKNEEPTPEDDGEWDETRKPSVNINDKNALTFRKQCKYNATLIDSEGVTNVPVYFYTSYNWSFNSLADDPTVSADKGGPDSAYPVVSSDSNFKISKFKNYDNSGKWIPVSGASFTNANSIYVVDGVIEKLKEFIMTLSCKDLIDKKCADMDLKDRLDNYSVFYSSNENASSFWILEAILNGTVTNDKKQTFNTFSGKDSSATVLSLNTDPNKNYCATLNGKVWYPSKFYACQKNIYEYGEGVFGVYAKDKNTGNMYVFTNQTDFNLFCDDSSESIKTGYLHKYIFEVDSSERYSSQFKLPQSVELKCEFKQDYYKDLLPSIDKAAANFFGQCSDNCTGKGSFSFIFGKDGSVKYTKGKGVGDLSIKFYFNNQDIENIYSVTSSTNVLDLNIALNLLVSDAGAYRNSKLAEAGWEIAVGIISFVGTQFVAKKIPLFRFLTRGKVKQTVKIIAIGLTTFAVAMDFMEIFNTFSTREKRTVFLTNYFELDSETLNKFKEEVNQENGYPYFEQFTLTKNTSQFTCTVMPYDGRGEDNPVEPEDVDCGILSGDFGKIVKYILNILRIVGVALMILLGVLDFTKALSSSDADAMQKAGSMFIKRLIIVVLILFVPAIIELLFSIIDKTSCSNVL